MSLMWNERCRRLAGGALVLGAAVLGASCGGGGTVVNNFNATRVLAFGDETSVIVDTNNDGNGSKYGVNAVDATTSTLLNCRGSTLWVQAIANRYGLVFPECNPGPSPVITPASRIRARFGAQAADLAAQIAAQNSEAPVRDGDIATVLVGINDVIAQYQQYPMLSEAQITANVEAAGIEAGRQVNRLADAGAKVLIATIPDVGKTPFAIAEQAGHIDTDRAALLSRLSIRFNALLRGTMTNDGHRIGIVLLDELIGSITAFPGTNGFVNVTTGVCDLTKSSLKPPSVLDCTTLTLVTDGSPTTYLWADDRHLSPGAQTGLGSLAVQRADNNPF